MSEIPTGRRSRWLWWSGCALCVLLIGMFAFPAVRKIMENYAAHQSKASLSFITFAIHDYEEHHRHFPPVAITNSAGEPLLSWRVEILQEIDPSLYEQFKLDEPWDSPHNVKLLDRMPECFRHPWTKTDHPGLTFYRGFTGKGTVFEEGKKVGFQDLQDGSSRVIMLVEAAEPVPWTKPEELRYDRDKPVPPLGGHFRSGFHAAFCDGHVHRIDHDVDEKVLRRVIIRNDDPPALLNIIR
jgi:hypothetical protein